jgi:lantibiotic modifying enzyme
MNHIGHRWTLGAKLLVMSAAIIAGAGSAQERPTASRAAAYREAAMDAGKWIRSTSIVTAKGTAWPAVPGNFKTVDTALYHGVSGVVLFFLEAHRMTGDETFLKDARADGDGYLVFHHEPGGEDLYYLGWCHGPAGTARLFYRLHQATGDSKWISWFERCAKSVLKSGIPEKRLPGFWNNVSVCCGSAGVAEFCLEVHLVTGDRRYLTLAEQLTADLLRRATRDDKGTRWVQAEHRVKPDLLIAHTGHMQGAAGVGAWLLRLERFSNGHRTRLVWPDSPFAADAKPASPQR